MIEEEEEDIRVQVAEHLAGLIDAQNDLWTDGTEVGKVYKQALGHAADICRGYANSV